MQKHTKDTNYTRRRIGAAKLAFRAAREGRLTLAQIAKLLGAKGYVSTRTKRLYTLPTVKDLILLGGRLAQDSEAQPAPIIDGEMDATACLEVVEAIQITDLRPEHKVAAIRKLLAGV